MSTEPTHSLRVSRVIQADVETVFRAWTEPSQLKLWSCPEGATVDDASVDLSVGGAYRIRMKGEEGFWTAVGVYREIDPPKRLVYTWDWEEKAVKMSKHDRLGSADETVVTVDFSARDGGTEVVVTHTLFPSLEAKDGHLAGWVGCLDKLERLETFRSRDV